MKGYKWKLIEQRLKRIPNRVLLNAIAELEIRSDEMHYDFLPASDLLKALYRAKCKPKKIMHKELQAVTHIKPRMISRSFSASGPKKYKPAKKINSLKMSPRKPFL